jgi:chlorobactene glucosyltransferase
MSPALTGALIALPWIALPVIMLARLRHSTALDGYPPVTDADAPMVSIIVPARNEAHHIDACVRSVLSSAYPRFEVIVVDDHSTDGTGEIARAIGDPRVRVIANPDLPKGWVGKQWACHNGAQHATGALLLFTDADTRHGPELLPRAVRAMQVRGADLMSVAGYQIMESFWEKAVQPQVFAMILLRYGGTDTMSRSTDPYAKIANGQYLLLRADRYRETGGHEAVKWHIAEDMRMAQEWTRRGLSVQLVVALSYMQTRMYASLREIIEGWGKNVYAGGRDAVPLGPLGQKLLRITFPAPALFTLAPVVGLVGGLVGAFSATVLAWGAISYAVAVLFWLVIYALSRQPVWYAFVYPIGAGVLLWIFTRAAWRGDNVMWKGRDYTVG